MAKTILDPNRVYRAVEELRDTYPHLRDMRFRLTTTLNAYSGGEVWNCYEVNDFRTAAGIQYVLHSHELVPVEGK